MAKTSEITVDGKRLAVSNLEKVLYPEAGFRKGDVLKYYIEISHVLLPHLKDRPLTLKRYPNGVEGAFFYERHCPSHRPPWVKTAKVPSRHSHEAINYCVIGDLPSLVWAANLADLELHTFLHRASAIERPACIAFDLDPGPGVDIIACCQVGLWVKEIFDAMGLESFPKTSGSKGLQIFVPLNSAANYEQTKSLAKAIAERLEEEHPDLVVSQMQKVRRNGKVLIDWSQNDSHKTTISVYSLRAKARPTVSTPLKWEEVEVALSKSDVGSLAFEYSDALKRAAKFGDLFEPVLSLRQKLPSLNALRSNAR